MANTYRNTALVSKVILKEYINALRMAKKVNRDRTLDREFAAGDKDVTISVQRPVEFKSFEGETLGTQDIESGTIDVTLDERHHVPFSISSKELAVNVKKSNVPRKYLRPAGKRLAQLYESKVAAKVDEIANLVGTPGTPPATFLDVGEVTTRLSNLGVPDDEEICAFYDPNVSLQLANGLKDVFVQGIAKKAIERALVGEYAGARVYMNQSLKNHTVGAYAGSTPLVNGANQEVTYDESRNTDTFSLVTDGWAFSTTVLKKGDVITIAGVNFINLETKEDFGELAQFVVLADVTSDGAGNATLLLGSALISDPTSPYQNVSGAPADDAVITVVTGTSGATYRHHLAFHPNAITLVVAKLDVPTEGVKAHRYDYDGFSLLVAVQYNIGTAKTTWRVDTFFGVAITNRGFAVKTTS
jgi:hypothetical protein